MAPGQDKRPLKGLRVLDFSHAAAAPFATMFLGDLGAEVIKIEKPKGGDGARTMGVPMPRLDRKQSDYYVSLNRNKRGISLDLSRPEGVQIARTLAAESDIVVQNFRPGVMERLGLGFSDLAAVRPGLIYCSISAFGPTGPWAGRPANDIIMQSVSGLMGVTGERGGGPVRIGAPIADFSSGLFALSGILAALHVRDERPEGQHVEISMLEASLNMMCNYIPSVATLGHRIPRLGRAHAQIVPYQAFECADGQYVMVGAFTRVFWQNLCRALGHEEWVGDARFATNAARLAHREELVGQIQEIFRSRTGAEWMDILDAADVPNSPVLELHDTLGLEQVVHMNSLVEIGEPGKRFRVVGNPIRSTQWGEARAIKEPPVIGEDTQAVLHDVLGLSTQEIDALERRNAIACLDSAKGKAQ